MTTVRHIVCAVDFSDCSKRALAHAAALARWYDATLTALHVWTTIPDFDVMPALVSDTAGASPAEDVTRLALERELRQVCATVADSQRITAVVTRAPRIEDEINAQVSALRADLLVIGSHGRTGVQRVLLGSIAEKVVRTAPCPVMVVPPHDATPANEVRFTRIICPIDFSDSSLAALEYAFSLAEESDGRLTVMHVLECPPELHALPAPEGIDVEEIRRAANADVLRRLRALVPASVRDYCGVETTVADGKTHRAVLAAAAESHADLIVMGVSGDGALDRWVFGSNTAGVMRGATCPVLIVRTPS